MIHLSQSGQLRESMQAGLVTKRVRRACAVEQLRLRVYIAEEEYRRALGLLRRKPMPNTKTGRFFVTSGTGGVTGGTSGLTRPQKQALMSVTKYLKLPVSSPSKDVNQYLAALSLRQSGKVGVDVDLKNKSTMFGGKRMKSSRALIDKILNKEVVSLRTRVRMCEDEWCEFAARDLAVMLRCARNVMQRRISGAITKDQLTPKCISLSLLRSLHQSLMSRNGPTSASATPRGLGVTTSVSNSHSNIALYPSEITFSHVDLVTSSDDDEHIVKSRRQEERDFASAFAHFADLVTELSLCRNHIQEKIIARLTTNPTIAHSKQLYLTKDIYLLMERWRNLVSKNFNMANDGNVQLLARQILSDPAMSAVIPEDLQEQFPGFVGLLPATFQVADQVLEKLQNLLTSAYGASIGTSMVYPTKTAEGQRRTISVRLLV